MIENQLNPIIAATETLRANKEKAEKINEKIEELEKKIRSVKKIDELLESAQALYDCIEHVKKLDTLIRQMAHYSGNNRLLIKNGFETWTPGKDDMRKFKT